jgi:hypothetical protein
MSQTADEAKRQLHSKFSSQVTEVIRTISKHFVISVSAKKLGMGLVLEIGKQVSSHYIHASHSTDIVRDLLDPGREADSCHAQSTMQGERDCGITLITELHADHVVFDRGEG